MLTGYTFRASWPILDPERPLAALRAEACRDIDVLAADENSRIVGDITWTVVDSRLIAEAPAVRSECRPRAYGVVGRNADLIAHLARQGLTDQRIADQIGCSQSAVGKVRRKHGIPPGRGEQQQRGVS
jgi:hypothetical protein